MIDLIQIQIFSKHVNYSGTYHVLMLVQKSDSGGGSCQRLDVQSIKYALKIGCAKPGSPLLVVPQILGAQMSSFRTQFPRPK